MIVSRCEKRDKETCMDLFDALSSNQIFKGLDNEEVKEIALTCSEKNYPNGAVIFTETSSDCGMYILVSGQVDIQMNIGIDTELATVKVIHEGEVFGELSLVDRAPRSAAAKAAGDSKTYHLNADKFDELVAKNSRIGFVVMKNIAKIVSSRLRETNIKYTESLIWEKLTSTIK
jgi:CRP/FNR family cyclic AMP-dependent transcriptional regulator